MNLRRSIGELWGRLRRRSSDDEIEEEIRAHIEIETEELIEAGMPLGEARYEARRKFGNVTLARERTREIWRIGWLDRLCQDVRVSARMLAKNRAFTLTAVLTLAVGIGATTAIFTVVHAVISPEYPFSDPDRIVYVATTKKDGTEARTPALNSFADWRQKNTVVRNLTAWRYTTLTWNDLGEPESVRGTRTTSDIFRLAGVHPMLGRDFRVRTAPKSTCRSTTQHCPSMSPCAPPATRAVSFPS